MIARSVEKGQLTETGDKCEMPAEMKDRRVVPQTLPLDKGEKEKD